MPLSWKDIELRASNFAKEWAEARYEKGDSQTFYNEFFEVFGISRKRVARFEEHVKLKQLQSGWIDLLWPGVLIVEQKSRGRDLAKAAQQAGDYFDALSDDDKPRYQLVCDFQSFSLTDRETRERTDFALPDFHKNVRFFAFMLGKQSPRHRAKERLNEKAAALVGKLHRDLTETRYPTKDLEVFLTQLVFCLFADNAGIFQPRGRFIDLIESRSQEDGSNLGQMLSHLFQILDTPLHDRQKGLDPELADFPYINGRLFAERIGIPALSKEMREDLLKACQFDWAEVSPAIFGALFQSILSREERREIGAFATSEKNILKVVDDLFLRSLKERLVDLCRPGALRRESLEAFHSSLRDLRFLDPACGCGNFLVIAYRELRQLELNVLQALDAIGALDGSRRRATVDVDQFFGIEQRTYSARIAEAALWMTDHIANNALSLTLNVDFHRVPLAATPTIVRGKNALTLDWTSVIAPTACTFILGNPPYKGPKYQTLAERQQIKKLAGTGADAGTLDLVCGWILKSAAYAMKGTRVGLVAINSVTEGEQVGQLWPLLYNKYSLELGFAHRPFHWYSESSGDSHVQVVVLGLSHKNNVQVKKRLYVYDAPKSDPILRECRVISPYLVVGDDLVEPHCVVKETSKPINRLSKLRTGTKPIDGGYYILDEDERQDLLKSEPGAAKYIRPFVGGQEFLNSEQRYLLVLEDAQSFELKRLPRVRELIRKVAAYRSAKINNKAGRKKLAKPNDLRRTPTKFHITSLPESPFLVIPEVSSEKRAYVPIGWLTPPTIPSNLVKYAEDASLVEFALLTSAMHMAWLRVIGGHLEGRYRYSIGIVYNTFPIPDSIQATKLNKLAQRVLNARLAAEKSGNTLNDMYESDLMPTRLRSAHAALDDEVDRQYLDRVALDEQERVVNLLNRYYALVSGNNG